MEPALFLKFKPDFDMVWYNFGFNCVNLEMYLKFISNRNSSKLIIEADKCLSNAFNINRLLSLLLLNYRFSVLLNILLYIYFQRK